MGVEEQSRVRCNWIVAFESLMYERVCESGLMTSPQGELNGAKMGNFVW